MFSAGSPAPAKKGSPGGTGAPGSTSKLENHNPSLQSSSPLRLCRDPPFACFDLLEMEMGFQNLDYREKNVEGNVISPPSFPHLQVLLRQNCSRGEGCFPRQLRGGQQAQRNQLLSAVLWAHKAVAGGSPGAPAFSKVPVLLLTQGT